METSLSSDNNDKSQEMKEQEEGVSTIPFFSENNNERDEIVNGTSSDKRLITTMNNIKKEPQDKVLSENHSNSNKCVNDDNMDTAEKVTGTTTSYIPDSSTIENTNNTDNNSSKEYKEAEEEISQNDEPNQSKDGTKESPLIDQTTNVPSSKSGNTRDNSNSHTMEKDDKSRRQKQGLTLPKSQRTKRMNKKRKGYRALDTVRIDVPDNVTIDLGIVLRRVRARRLKQLQKLFPDMNIIPPDDTNDDNHHDQASSNNGKSSTLEKKSTSPIPTHPNNTTTKKDKFGSVLDYLEAKYVKGVTVSSSKKSSSSKKKKEKNLQSSWNNKDLENDEDEESIMSKSEAGSCYSNDSGFIDDSELTSEVAQQVMSNTATTRMEADPGFFTRDPSKTQNVDYDDNAFFVNVGDLEMANEAGNADGWESEDYNSIVDYKKVRPKDHAKKKRRNNRIVQESKQRKKISSDKKNITKKKGKSSNSTSNHRKISSKEKISAKKRKRPSEQTNLSSALKKKKSQTEAKKKIISSSKKQKHSINDDSSTTSSPSKLEKKNFKKKSNFRKVLKQQSQVEEESDNEEEDESSSSDSSEDNDDDENDHTKNKINEGSDVEEEEEDDDDDDGGDESSSSSNESEEDERLKQLKKKSEDMRRKMKKYYKQVHRDVRGLTEEHLPRKPKKNQKVKVSIVVPAGKKSGDMITFSNPHVPGQKLKVKIPNSASPGGKFVVSVPMPEVSRSTNTQNNIPREIRDRLDEYSQVYDDWCSAEASYRDELPKQKGKKVFKAAVERLKKFDSLLKEFPTDLAHPIDASYLRKVVRRARQNSSKRRKLALEKNSAAGTTPSSSSVSKKGETTLTSKKKKGKTVEKEVDDNPFAPDPVIELTVPGRGTTFPSVRFDPTDFNRTQVT